MEDVESGSARAIDWQRGYPYVWREIDVETLFASPLLFARKFSRVDMNAVLRIQSLTKETEINGKD